MHIGDLPGYVTRLLRPRAPGEVVALVADDGAIVAGETLDYSAYQARYGSVAHRAVRVPGLTLRR